MEILALLFLLAFTPGGDMVAAPDDYGNVILWSAASGEQVQMLEANSDQVMSIAMRPDGKYMVTGGKDGSVALWDMQKRVIIKTQAAHADWVLAAQFSKDGNVLMTASRDGTMCFWTMPEFIRIGFVMTDAGHLFTASLSPDAQWATAVAADGALYVWKGPKTWKLNKKIEGVNALTTAFNPSGDLFVTGGDQGEIRAYRMSGDSWAQVRSWTFSLVRITNLEFCPDSKCLMMISDYERAYTMPMREDATPSLVYDASGEDQFGVWDLAFSSDGARLATIDAAGQVAVIER
jgi:WD40 repeat protein